MTLNIPYLTYTDIGKESQAFLKQYHSTIKLPIPIEKIVDVKMGINIFPFPRLYKDYGQNGFLSADRKTIYVDEVQYDQFNKKYRYTLAHEVGHYILHKGCYEDLPFTTPYEYIKWKISIPSDDLNWFETQADWFAGQVPRIPLKKICIEVVNRYKKQLSNLIKTPDDFWSYASNEIARYFEVNPPVVEIRIKKEGLVEEIPVIE